MSNAYNATGLYNPDGSVKFYGDTNSEGSGYVKQEELSNLVLTGTTNTTGATIASGTCFVLNGDFVTAKVDIAANATFTLNTNYEKKSVGSILTELNGNLEKINQIINITDTPIDLSTYIGDRKAFVFICARYGGDMGGVAAYYFWVNPATQTWLHSPIKENATIVGNIDGLTVPIVKYCYAIII